MATQAQLATTQADLATTKAELAKIKADLAKTKTDLGTWFAQFPLTLKRILPKLIWSK
jgi:outer membrane protein TolC